jgi:hypothetical protein
MFTHDTFQLCGVSTGKPRQTKTLLKETHNITLPKDLRLIHTEQELNSS